MGFMRKSTFRLACIMAAFFIGRGSSRAQWTHTADLVGIVDCITAGPPTGAGGSTTLYAGSWNGGVFLSSNGGASWKAAFIGLTNTQVQAIVAYMATNGTNVTNLFAATAGGGVFLSTDNGLHWAGVNNGLTDTKVLALIQCPAPGGMGGVNLFAGTRDGGVFRSTNDGTSWTAVNNGLTSLNVWSLAVSQGAYGSVTKLFTGTGGSGLSPSPRRRAR
jgi:hypothetical protein